MLTGTIGSEPALPAKAAGFPPAPPAGILTRFLALAKSVKNNKNYTVAIGTALGLEGAEQIGPDMATVQPDLTAKIMGNTVVIPWGWGGNGAYLDLCEMTSNEARAYSIHGFGTPSGLRPVSQDVWRTSTRLRGSPNAPAPISHGARRTSRDIARSTKLPLSALRIPHRTAHQPNQRLNHAKTILHAQQRRGQSSRLRAIPR